MFEAEIKTLKSLNTYLIRLVESRLWLKVLIGMIAGALIGLALSPSTGWVNSEVSATIGAWTGLPGKLFLKLVQMIMIPLIFASIVKGITSNSIDQLRTLGLGVLGYFVVSTMVAISIGTMLSLALKPGQYLPQSSESETISSGSASGIKDLPTAISDLLPSNPLASMVTGEMLSVVIFTVIIGIAILSLKTATRQPILKLLSALQEICMIIVNWAMRLVPVAVFGLMIQLTANLGVQSLAGIGYYIVVVVIGLIALLIVYLLMVGLVGRTSPFKFLKAIRDVQLLAFSTTSSAAVMPLSMKTADEKLGVSPAISNFVIPIGATVNMDGTALYQCVTTLFVAQSYGLDMSMANIILTMVTIVAASIGTPSIPGGGVIILASVFQSVGIPTEGIVMIIGVERILGMFRTAINVTGDLTACVLFERWLGQKPNQP